MEDRTSFHGLGLKWIASYRVCIAFSGLYHVRIIKLHGGRTAVRLSQG